MSKKIFVVLDSQGEKRLVEAGTKAQAFKHVVGNRFKIGRPKNVFAVTDAETGKKYVARADDGIHMTTRGYRFVASPLLKRIKALAPTAPNTVDEGQ